jgi:SAM-dependent methyltransferase
VDQEQVLKLYDNRYAREYDEKFLHSPIAKPDTEFEIQTLQRLLSKGGPWVDVACGTGYFLSRFPGIERVGLDLSPAMLAVASARNPGVQFLEQNYLDEMPDWRNRWAVVSCMWYAYGLVSSMTELQQLVENLANWTAPDGVCFVPLCDPVLVSGVPLPYEVTGSPWPGKIVVTGITWTYVEEGNSRHEDMIAPHVAHMQSLFRVHFEELELITYPSGRAGLLARRKRKSSEGE